MSQYGNDWLDVEFDEDDYVDILTDFKKLLVIFGAHKSNYQCIAQSIKDGGSTMTMRKMWTIHRETLFAGIDSILDLV